MALKKFTRIVWVAILVLASCTTPQPTTPTGTPESADVPRFESADCWFDTPPGQTVECGYLIVPEDRSQPGGETIKLAVARFQSSRTNPKPDPIVYLEGGPGGSPLRGLVDQFSVIFTPFLADRDLILVDQRGTGYSQPALDCPEYKQLVLDTLDENLTADQSEEKANQALLTCSDRLSKTGINLAAFDSAENAADVSDLRKALGIEQWNLYGISYGTRLALTIMRDFPEGIRSVVIDSVYPPQVDLFASTPTNGERAFEVLFDACEGDADCSAAYPGLRDVFFETIRQFNQSPPTFTVTLKSGERYTMLLNGDGLMAAVFQSMYATSLLPFLPRLIYEVRDGNYALLAALQGEFLGQLDDISSGMYYSVQCSEEVPFTTPDALKAFTAVKPEYRPLASPGIYALCQQWAKENPNPIENQPVNSDIPTLIFGGEFDPITPPDWAALTAKTLPNSFYFELPGAGHGASLSVECPRDIALAFLDDPKTKPDDSCIAEKMANLKFAEPVSALSIKLVPFEEDTLHIIGVTPEGWVEVSPGVYTPSGAITDQQALLQQVVPLGADAFLRFLGTQLEQSGFKAKFEKVDSRSANNFDWTIYSASASIAVVDVALAEKNGQSYLVLMQSLVDEHDALYNALFLPAVDALKTSGR